MQDYKNLNGDSGVTKYEIGDDFITVEFNEKNDDCDTYTYTYSSAGKDNIEKMKKLAEQGSGLHSFIRTEVRKKYETRS